MAHLVEKHYSVVAAAMIPEYWQPDGTMFKMPCSTKEEAEELEIELRRDRRMKTFADVKRRLTVGTGVMMVKHDWYPNGSLIGLPRVVDKCQTQSVRFDNGSWLDFPLAKDVRIDSEDRFSICLDDADSWMTYEFLAPEVLE